MAEPTEPNGSLLEKTQHILGQYRNSRKLVLLIVAIGLLLDNMLLTSVVPIIPAFLYELHHQKDMIALNESYQTSTPTPAQEWNRRVEQSASENSQLLSKIVWSRRQKPPFLSPQCEKAIEEYLMTTTELSTTPEAPTTMPPSDEVLLRHEELVNENTEVGIMFASKPIVQALTNPFIGPLTNKIGYSWPLFSGLILLFISTMIFAVGTTYPTLFLARSLQGIGSAFTSTAGMGMIAEKFPDDRERGNSMAIALGGLALGVLIGPPFGGLMYEFVGKSSPFIILAMFALMDGCLQLLVLQPKVVKDEQEGASLLTLIRDPYILVAAGAITFANLGIAILEPSLPLWMMDTMQSSNWEQGAAFLPASISYLVGTNIFGPLGHRMGRWLASFTGLVIIGIAVLIIPTSTSLSELTIPTASIGFAIGYLVDIRHTSIYGSVYAIGDVAFCLGFVFGPTLSGTLVRWLGFSGLCTTTSLVCFCFAPCMLMLRNPPGKNENKILLNEGAVKYVNYTNDETPEEELGNIHNMKRTKSFEMVP
ncbi:hypothetical protein BLOT_007336 [Blomia tropicalis]|nr:hypothetical protein BLOT_007336 [Blomia tropicalis]